MATQGAGGSTAVAPESFAVVHRNVGSKRFQLPLDAADAVDLGRIYFRIGRQVALQLFPDGVDEAKALDALGLIFDRKFDEQ